MTALPATPVFAAIAALLIALALRFILPGLVGRASPRRDVSRSELNASVYRSQMADLDRDLAMGLLDGGQYTDAREELHRRLLTDTAGGEAVGSAPVGVHRRWPALVLAAGLPIAAAALYLQFGDPRALDEAATPFLEQAEGNVDPAQGDALMLRLRSHLASQPRDGRGWVLLARMQFDRDQFVLAADAYGKAVAVSPRVASDPAVLCEYADALGMAQGGSLAGRPSELIGRALALDARHPKALEMAGSAAFEQGRHADALRYWEQLLAQLRDGSQLHRELAAAIARTRRLAALAPAQ